ncbi:MAG: inositol monophosphatase family protein, partial [Alphaproteobacteria bacterium]
SRPIMTLSAYCRLLAGAEDIAERAAAVLTSMQGRQRSVSRKALLDVVTDADIASETLVLKGLAKLTPEAAILSEEAGFRGLPGGARWIVDPLDGTVNYAAGLPWFSVTMAYQENDETKVGILNAPLAGILARYVAGELATVNGVDARVSTTASLSDAIVSVILTSHFDESEVARTSEIVRRLGGACRGVRIIVSGGLEMSLVASARLDAYVSLKADNVSHAAGMPLVRAAGGRVTTLSGLDSNDDTFEKIASNGLLHQELLDCLSRV